jgi:copper oxidase (laccase) domain-containing protein
MPPEPAPGPAQALPPGRRGPGSFSRWPWTGPRCPAWPRSMSTRAGGASAAPWGSLNLGEHVGDDPAAVRDNRRRWSQALGGAQPRWLRQVHGAAVVEATRAGWRAGAGPQHLDRPTPRWPMPSGPASPACACSVLVADCLPVLLAATTGAPWLPPMLAGAGWPAGVVEAALGRACAGGRVPARRPCRPGWARASARARFEVGEDVVQALGGRCPLQPAGLDAPSAVAPLARRPARPGGRPPAPRRRAGRVTAGRWCTVRGRLKVLFVPARRHHRPPGRLGLVGSLRSPTRAGGRASAADAGLVGLGGFRGFRGTPGAPAVEPRMYRTMPSGSSPYSSKVKRAPQHRPLRRQGLRHAPSSAPHRPRRWQPGTSAGGWRARAPGVKLESAGHSWHRGDGAGPSALFPAGSGPHAGTGPVARRTHARRRSELEAKSLTSPRSMPRRPSAQAVADSMKALGGLQLPVDAWSRMQADYLQAGHEAVERRARAGRRPPRPEGPALLRHRVGREPGHRLHGADVPAERAHAHADGRQRAGRCEDRARVRFAVQQWIDAASPSNFLAHQPRGAASAPSTPRARAWPRACSSCGQTCRRAMSRRPTRASSRSAATSPPPRARWSTRTSFFQLLEYKPLTRQVHEQADAVRAAVHQQVLHPRPAARELRHPLHGGAGAPRVRGELAQPRTSR